MVLNLDFKLDGFSFNKYSNLQYKCYLDLIFKLLQSAQVFNNFTNIDAKTSVVGNNNYQQNVLNDELLKEMIEILRLIYSKLK